MSTYLTETKRVEKKKRLVFLGTTGAGVFLTFFSTLFLGLPILGAGAYFGMKWFQYRAKNGMRF